MNTKLSICIFTFNRPALLCETLRAFIPQVKPYDIEICISDNSQNDETERVVIAAASDYPHVRYHRNSHNIGCERNKRAAAAMAKSDYIWVFCDDDLPSSGAVDKIYEQLVHEPAVIMINCRPMTKDMKPFGVDSMTGINEDRWYDKPEQFLMDLAWYSTFVGGLVVKKTLWESVDMERYYETLFLHVGVIFEALLQSKARVLFLAQPLIEYRSENASWQADCMSIMFRQWPKVISLLPATYSSSVKEKAILAGTSRWMNLKTLFRLRQAGFLNIKTFHEYVLPFWYERKHRFGCAGKILLVAAICSLIPAELMQRLLNVRNNFHDKNRENSYYRQERFHILI